MENDKIKKSFSIFNGGEGLDHWSYSSTSTPFAKNLIGYTFPQEVRRKFAFRYKANFGNLVNNVVQKMIADVIYKSKTIFERHRHRYEVNMALRDKFEKKGMLFTGISPDNKLPEIIELKNHPWFVGVQYHPEFKSRPLNPHPLFSSFIKAAKKYRW